MKKLFMVLPLALVLCFLIGCQDKVEWKGTIEEEEGVTVVKNPREPIYGPEVFNLEEDLIITNEAGEDEYLFQDIWNLAVDDEENIYVSDRKAAHIQVFDKNGEYLRTIGSRGQGPGELQTPVDLKALSQGVLVVNDFYQSRLSYFSLEGKHLRDVSVHKYLYFRRPAIDSQGNIVAGFMVPEDEQLKYELAKFDYDVNPVFTVTTYPMLTSASSTAWHYFEQRRSTNLVWTVNELDQIIWGHMSKYELFVHNPDGKLIKKIVRDYDGIEITNQEKETLIKDLVGDNPVPPNIDFQFPERYPPFIRFSCDDEGRIYVQTYDKTEDGEADYYDVFDAEGKYIARFSLKYWGIVWKKQKLYTIEEDEEGFQIVRRYHITWKI
jgi:hypothetical protein